MFKPPGTWVGISSLRFPSWAEGKAVISRTANSYPPPPPIYVFTEGLLSTAQLITGAWGPSPGGCVPIPAFPFPAAPGPCRSVSLPSGRPPGLPQPRAPPRASIFHAGQGNNKSRPRKLRAKLCLLPARAPEEEEGTGETPAGFGGAPASQAGGGWLRGAAGGSGVVWGGVSGCPRKPLGDGGEPQSRSPKIKGWRGRFRSPTLERCRPGRRGGKVSRGESCLPRSPLLQTLP